MKRGEKEKEREHGQCANKVTIKANTDYYIMQDKTLMNRGGGFMIN